MRPGNYDTTRPMTTREIALTLAIDSFEGPPSTKASTENIVGRAQAFYDFLSGATTAGGMDNLEIRTDGTGGLMIHEKTGKPDDPIFGAME